MDVSDLAGFCDDMVENLNQQIAELQCEVDYNNTVIEKYRALVREYEQEIKQLKERVKSYEGN